MPLSCPSCDAFNLSGDVSSDNLRCASCNSEIDANLLPLFVITGASGTGKSTLVCHLRPLIPECFVVGGDLLVDVTNRDRRAFLGRWLRVAYASAQCGRPLVLACVIEKGEIEMHVDRSLVGPLYMIVLAVDEQERVARLEARPRWATHSEEKRAGRIAEHADLTGRLVQDADLVVNSAGKSANDVAKEAATWIQQRLVASSPSKAPAG